MLKKLYTNFLWFLKLYRREYSIALIFIILNYVLILLPPWMVGFIADGVATSSFTKEEVIFYVAILFFAIVVIYIVNYIWQYYVYKASDVISKTAREYLMRKFLRQSPLFYAKNSTGSLLGKATNDVVGLEDMAGFGCMSLMDASLMPIAIIAIMGITISWKLTFFAVLPLPILIYVSFYLGKKLYPLYDVSQEAFDQMNEDVLDNVAGVRVVRAYATEDIQMEQFRESSEELYKRRMHIVKWHILFPLFSKIIPAFSYIIAISYGAYLISQGTLALGSLLSFIIFLDLLVWPMFALGEFINVAQMGLASMDRIKELLNYKEELPELTVGEPFVGSADIRFEKYSFSYPEDRIESLENLKGKKEIKNALDDITFELKAGQTLGVVGKVGSGKTTLLKQLLRFYPIDRGQLFLSDKDILDYSISSIRSHIAYSAQNVFLFSKSIRENISLGSQKEYSEEALLRAIHLADFEKDLAQLPHGLDTQAGEKGIALSGGQKQRISIARALIRDPEILILDDSLSAVDAKTEECILANLKQTRSGKTTIISGHRLSCVMHADLILVLDQGKIVERGNHQELMKQNGWYKTQFIRQELEKNREEVS